MAHLTYPITGVEIETEQSRTAKSRVGFSSWEEKKIADPNELTLDQIAVRLGRVGLTAGWYDEKASELHPNKKFHFEVWGDRKLVTDAKLKVGQLVRAKTKGASHFVDVIWPADSTPLTAGTSYAGEDVKSGWDEKIMSKKGIVNADPVVKEDPNKDGVDDDEWD